MKKIKSITQNIIYTLISISLCLLILELSLRYFYPKYRYAADISFKKETNRIWEYSHTKYYHIKHYDKNTYHLVYHNNLGSRQHRDIKHSTLEKSITIAIFGDSYTANIGLPIQFSLSEPLDYLLNQTPNNYTVLNFGVDGYSTDQVYLWYQEMKEKINFKHTFYIFCINDIRGLYENNLFSLTPEPTAPDNNFIFLTISDTSSNKIACLSSGYENPIFSQLDFANELFFT